MRVGRDSDASSEGVPSQQARLDTATSAPLPRDPNGMPSGGRTSEERLSSAEGVEARRSTDRPLSSFVAAAHASEAARRSESSGGADSAGSSASSRQLSLALARPATPSTLTQAIETLKHDVAYRSAERQTQVWTEAARQILLSLLAEPEAVDGHLAQLTTQRFPQLNEALPAFTLHPASRERDWLLAPRHAARGGGDCLCSLFLAELHTSLLRLVSCRSTPQEYAGHPISAAQYLQAMLHGLLLGRMLISRQWEAHLFEVVQDVLVRTLFTGAFEQTPSAGLFLVALFGTAGAELCELFTRRAGTGVDFVWYDDNVTSPHVRWAWPEAWSRFKWHARNPSERIHPYVREAQLDMLAKMGEDPTLGSLRESRVDGAQLLALHTTFVEANQDAV